MSCYYFWRANLLNMLSLVYFLNLFLLYLITPGSAVEVKPDQVKGAIASLSMLSYTGKREFPSVEDELPAVPLPPHQLSQLSQDLSDSEPEEIPDW